VTVVAVAIAVMAAVIMLTGGVVAESDTPDTLAFFGVSVRTTSAQIFLTGAICTWALLASAWLLSTGLRRSRERAAQLALIRATTAHSRERSEESDLTGLSGAVESRADRAGSGDGRNRGGAQTEPAEQEPLWE
jgi:hypothetical protein